MVAGDGTTTYTYDNADRLTERAAPAGTVDFSYDNADRLHIRTLVGTGTSTYSYDNADRTTSVAVPGVSGSETTSYTHDATGRLLTTTYANGDVETNSYDATTEDLTSVVQQNSSSSTIASYAYTCDNNGRVTQETLADGSYHSYGYDAGGQLTSESLNSGGTGTVGALHGYSYTYTYDAAGNRATKYNGTTTESYSYDNANKLTSAGAKSYAYDNNGNCTSVYNSTSGVTVTLGYDGESRMTSASDSASVFSNTYSYNGLNQRVGKTDNAGTFSYTHEDDVADSSVLSDGAAVYNHGAAENDLLSEVRSSTSKYYHSDSLGSTGTLTNSSGTTTDTRLTDAFGMSVASSGTTTTPFGFVGQEGYQGDADTGLILVGYRYYDSSTGRFLSRDPSQDGYNWYSYCDNDPVNYCDSDGLQKTQQRPHKKPATPKQAAKPKVNKTIASIADKVIDGSSIPPFMKAMVKSVVDGTAGGGSTTTTKIKNDGGNGQQNSSGSGHNGNGNNAGLINGPGSGNGNFGNGSTGNTSGNGNSQSGGHNKMDNSTTYNNVVLPAPPPQGYTVRYNSKGQPIEITPNKPSK